MQTQEAASQKLSVLTTKKPHLEDEIKMLETTVSDLEMELEIKEFTEMNVWKEDGDGVVTGQVTGRSDS